MGTKLVSLHSSASAWRAQHPSVLQLCAFCCRLILHQPPSPWPCHAGLWFFGPILLVLRQLSERVLSSDTASYYVSS